MSSLQRIALPVYVVYDNYYREQKFWIILIKFWIPDRSQFFKLKKKIKQLHSKEKRHLYL